MSDTERFRVIYDAHHAAICAYFARRVARDEVEDLAAETFVVAWRKLPRRIEHPLPWLYAVAGNVLSNHRRKAARRGSFPADPAGGDPAERVGDDRGLARAFAGLSERDREAICLVAWEGLSTADAARAAGCSDFEGLADFDALVLDPPRRQRRRLLTLPALGAVIAALVFVPTSAPQASEVLRKASAALDVGDGILYARSSAETRSALDGTSTSFGSRRVWVLGEQAMRWLEDDGDEEVFQQGAGLTRVDGPSGEVTRNPESNAVPTEVFRAGALLASARAGKDVKLDGEATVNGRPAYVLRWNEKSGPPYWPTIEMTLWVDKETFAPLRFTDHSYGKAVDGKPFDQTYTENVLEFKTLPDTPENRTLLELSRR